MQNLGRAVRALVGLAFVCGQALGCLPSDFDELEETTQGATSCDASNCPDASQLDPPGLDSSVGAPHGDLDGSPSLDGSVVGADAGGDAGQSVLDGEVPLPPVPCGGSGAICQANEPGVESEACGDCGSGTRTRTRACAADGCSWGEWSAWGACGGEHTACAPGAKETRSAACTTCGSRTQARTCSPDTCTWGAWSDTSACTWCEQCSEVVYCDTPANIANRGTWCRQTACSREQALADCKEDVERVCGAFTQPFLMEYQ
jgi:hypothetical protein